MLQPLGPGDDGRRLRLGAGVELHDHVSPPSQSIQASFSQGGQGAARCQTVRSDETSYLPRTSLGQAPDAAHHGRHHVEPGGLVSVDRRQRLLGVEPRQQHEVGAEVEAGDRAGERAVVIERPRHHHHVVGRRAGSRPTPARCVDDRRLARQDQLRPAGRAAGGRRLEDRRDAVLQRAVVVRERQQRVDVVARALALDGVAGDQDAGVGQRHHRLGLVRRQPPGDRLRRRAGFPERRRRPR